MGDLADFYILRKFNCSSSLEVFNYSSRDRLKTIILSTHLTTFCKLNAYFFSIFHGSFALVFSCTNILETMRKLLGAGTQNVGRVGRFSFTSFLLSSPWSQLLWKERNWKSISVLPSSSKKPCSRIEVAGTKWLKRMGSGGIVSKHSTVLGRTGCCPALCDQSPALWPAGQRGHEVLFLRSKVHSEFIGCPCGWFQWVLLGGKTKIWHLLLVSHSSATALPPSGGGNSSEIVWPLNTRKWKTGEALK